MEEKLMEKAENQKKVASFFIPLNHQKVEYVCVSCKKTVVVKPVFFGGGYIAVCPECDELAMNTSVEEVETLKKIPQPQ